MITQLALQEIQTNDCKFLRIADNSSYNTSVPIENPILEITVPGFTCATFMTVAPGFNQLLNSSTLKMAPATAVDSLLILPDGPYKIKYSIKPNDKLFVEYILFRTCQITQRHLAAVCALFSDQCSISRLEFESKRKDLIWIRELIEASKSMAEECGDSDKATELYNEANRLLTSFNNNCNC